MPVCRTMDRRSTTRRPPSSAQPPLQRGVVVGNRKVSLPLVLPFCSCECCIPSCLRNDEINGILMCGQKEWGREISGLLLSADSAHSDYRSYYTGRALLSRGQSLFGLGNDPQQAAPSQWLGDGIPAGVVVVDDSEHGFTDRSEFHDPLLGTSACQTKGINKAVVKGPIVMKTAVMHW